MNLFIRMLLIIVAARRAVFSSLLSPRRDKFRVWLHDLGWRDHLPNYRVFSFMELGRFGLWHQSRLALSGRYSIRMIAAQDFIYLKPIKPFQSFDMTTEILSWDEKYVYYQHKFFTGKNLVAIGLVKEIALKSGKAVSPMSLIDANSHLARINSEVDIPNSQPQMHPITEQWLQTQQEIKLNCS